MRLDFSKGYLLPDDLHLSRVTKAAIDMSGETRCQARGRGYLVGREGTARGSGFDPATAEDGL